MLKNFVAIMQNEFEMSLVRELKLFIRFQVKQMNNGIFLSQEKYTKDLVKKFELDNVKPTRTLMSTTFKLFQDPFRK